MRLFGVNSENYKRTKTQSHVKGNYDAKNDRTVLHII